MPNDEPSVLAVTIPDLYHPPDRLEALMGRLATAMEAAGQLTLAEACGDARRLRRRRH